MSQSVTMIPLSKLIPSPENVRKTHANDAVEELAASIKAHGLLQNLTVRPARHNGKTLTTFEVVAGSRRLAALKRLSDEKILRKTFPVPCRILKDEDATEVSLVENVVRAAVHPADQFEAFASLRNRGRGPEEIAARFGVTAAVVLQRLKLAAVSPRLMAQYREGAMGLEQLMAFTISDDHEAQERIWFEGPYQPKDAASIRRALTREHVEGADRRARFVGVEAYEAAGGRMIRDLFQSEIEGYFTDSELLERLTTEKLNALAEEVRKEGWSWVEILPEVDYDYLARMTRSPATLAPLSKRAERRLNRLVAREERLTEEQDDEPPEAIAGELSSIQKEIKALTSGRERWSEKEKKRAGVVIALGYDGVPRIERGLLRPSERSNTATKRNKPEKPYAERASTLSEKLIEDLSAHYTAAVREVLAGKPEIALAAALYTLTLRIFYDPRREACVDVRPEQVELTHSAGGIAESPAVVAYAHRKRQWETRLPPEADLWSWLIAQDLSMKLDLLAICAAATVNAVQKRAGAGNDEHLKQAHQVAAAIGLDMADWWQPTTESYFNRVPKALVLSAVAEGVSPQASENIGRMKKAAMNARAEELLSGKRWVPTLFRRVGNEAAGEAAAV